MRRGHEKTLSHMMSSPAHHKQPFLFYLIDICMDFNGEDEFEREMAMNMTRRHQPISLIDPCTTARGEDPPSGCSAEDALRELHQVISGPNSSLLAPEYSDSAELNNDELFLSAFTTPLMTPLEKSALIHAVVDALELSNKQDYERKNLSEYNMMTELTEGRGAVRSRKTPTFLPMNRSSQHAPSLYKAFSVPTTPLFPTVFTDNVLTARQTPPMTDTLRMAKRRGKQIHSTLQLPDAMENVIGSKKKKKGRRVSNHASEPEAAWTVSDLLKANFLYHDATLNEKDSPAASTVSCAAASDGSDGDNTSSRSAVLDTLNNIPELVRTRVPVFPSTCNSMVDVPIGVRRRSAQDVIPCSSQLHAINPPISAQSRSDTKSSDKRSHKEAEKCRRDALKHAFQRLKTVLSGLQPGESPWKVQVVEMAYEEILRLRQEALAKDILIQELQQELQEYQR